MMTRDEVIVLCKELYEQHVIDSPAEFVAVLESRGVLNIDEPKSPEARFARLTVGLMPATVFRDLSEAMKAAGLKIIEK